MKKSGLAAGIAESITALILTAGSLTVFRACEAEEGHFMNCHWAQNAVLLAGAALTLISMLRAFIRDRGIGTGLSLSVFVLSAVTAFIPQTAISLCMMETMRCHTVFRPAVILLSSVLAVVSGIDAVMGLIRSGKNNEH